MDKKVLEAFAEEFHKEIVKDVPELIRVYAKTVIQQIKSIPNGMTREQWIEDNISLALHNIWENIEEGYKKGK